MAPNLAMALNSDGAVLVRVAAVAVQGSGGFPPLSTPREIRPA
jgi:hypothetical protein